MIQDVLVLDDVVSKSYQDSIEASILYNKNFPWFYNPSLSKPFDDDSHDEYDSHGWVHTFIDIDKGDNSFLSSRLVPLAQEASQKVGMYCTKILNGRVFQLFPDDNSILNQPVWHIDIVDPHMVCLYYVNDSTGDTKISSKKFTQGDQTSFVGSLPVEYSISPKKGRAVFFDGSRYHHASNPQKGRRVIINFNLQAEEI